MFRIMLIIFLLCFTVPAYSERENPLVSLNWQPFSQTTFSSAEKSDQMILVVFEAKWCHWCQLMMTTTFSDPLVIETINQNYSVIRVDIETQTDVASRYLVSELPTYVILNSHQEILDHFSGYLTAQELLGRLSRLQGIVQSDLHSLQVSLSGTLNGEESSILSAAQRTRLMNQVDQIYDSNLEGKLFPVPKLSLLRYSLNLAELGNKDAAKWAQIQLDQGLGLIDPAKGGVLAYSSHHMLDKDHIMAPLPVQAGYIRIYAIAYELWKKPAYLKAAKQIAQYVLKSLSSPEGVFYHNEIKSKQTNTQAIITRDNGLMISALANLYISTGEIDYLNRASQAANWIIANQGLKDFGFKHAFPEKSDVLYLADTLEMARAMAVLYETSFNPYYLARSELALLFINNNFHAAVGEVGYVSSVSSTYRNNKSFALDPDDNAIIVRVANTLYLYTKNVHFHYIQNTAMRALVNEDIMYRYPQDTLYADLLLNLPPIAFNIVGNKNDAQARNLYLAALRFPSPSTLVKWDDTNRYDPLAIILQEKPNVEVCVLKHCVIPIYNSNELLDIVSHFVSNPALISQFKIVNKPVNHAAPSYIYEKITSTFKNPNKAVLLAEFWLIGLLLTLTPCVLPVVLILPSMLLGNASIVSGRKLFLLTLTYVLSLSLTYTVAGILSASFGIYLQDYLHRPWVVMLFCFLLLVLGSSLLNAFAFKMPAVIRHRLVGFNSAKASTSYIGVFFMGIVATLIAAPCTAGPIICTLGLITQTGNVLIGGAALFAMGLGVSTPIILCMAVGKPIYFKNKSWQYGIKQFFGLVMIGVAIYIVSGVVLPIVTLSMWSVFTLVASFVLGLLRPVGEGFFNITCKTASFLLFILAMLMLFKAIYLLY